MVAWQKIAIASVAGLVGCERGAPPATLEVFAAASLAEPFTELGKSYEASHPGISVRFNFAGSNVLRLQIEQDAPADVFASANSAQMTALRSEGLVDAESVHLFAGNRLVIIVPSSNPAEIHCFADLAKPGLKLIAADKAVPAGAYFENALQRAGETAQYGERFSAAVMANLRSREENVEAVVSKVRMGIADAGIAYQSDLHRSGGESLKGVSIPSEFNPGAEYPIGIVSHARSPKLAHDFERFVLSPQGQRVLRAHDFLTAQ